MKKLICVLACVFVSACDSHVSVKLTDPVDGGVGGHEGSAGSGGASGEGGQSGSAGQAGSSGQAGSGGQGGK